MAASEDCQKTPVKTPYLTLRESWLVAPADVRAPRPLSVKHFERHFLVEEAAFLDVARAVRWLRRVLPSWSGRRRKRWPQCLTEPFTALPPDPDGGWALLLDHTWSRRWNAPIYWFLCPVCGRRVRRLVRLHEDDFWACRGCHRAKYVSQLQSDSAVAAGHLEARNHYNWLMSQPGPKSRSVRRLKRKLDRTAWALETPWGRLVKQWREERMETSSIA